MAIAENIIKKTFALFLSTIVFLTMVPVNVFATETIDVQITNTTTFEKEENANVPTMPTLNSVTSTVIILNGVDNCEYSIDGENWQESYVFKELQPNTIYKLYQRYSETDTVLASKASEPLEVTTKGKSNNVKTPELVSVKGNVVTLTEVSGYEYKYIGGEWQSESIFVLDSFTSYEFVQREKETETMEASDVSCSIFVSTGRITELPEGATGIYTKSDLNAIRNETNSNSYYILMNDIKFIDADYEEYGEFYNDGCGWAAINIFRGRIDGNGYTIKGLKNVSDKRTCFININYGQILNLTLDNIEFSASNENSTEYLYLAGFVGTNRGIIEGCNVSGKIIAKNYDGNYASGAFAGGICTSNYGEINQCSNIATISVEAYDSAYAGGIVGRNETDGIIVDCYNIGEIITFINDKNNAYTYAGGIVGRNSGQIKTCYNIGAVDSRRNSNLLGAYSGGIVGDNDGIMENCYYSELQKKAAGENLGTGAEKLTLSKLNQQESYNGFDFNEIWSMGSGDFPIPYLKGKVTLNLSDNINEFASGNGTIISPYYIETKQQLANINNHLGAAYILNNDISFQKKDFEEGGMFYNDGKGWLSIGSDCYTDFEGIFDGQNYTVNGLALYNQNYMGLFGYVRGEIKNINVEDIYIESDSTNTVYAGGLAGAYYGNTLTNCTSNANINVINAYNLTVGGLVGLSTGDIIQCFSVGELKLDSSICEGLNSEYAGGLVGRCFGSIKNSYNRCNVYLSYYRSNDIYIGGIIGCPGSSASIENCYTVGKLYSKSNNTEKDCSKKLYGKSSSSYDISVINSYLLNDNESVLYNGIDIARKSIQFSSGEITYLLNNKTSNSSSIWKQNLGDNEDSYPVLNSDHNIVYKCDKYNCQNQLDGNVYSNIERTVYENHDIIYYEAQQPTCSSVGWNAHELCKNCGYTTYTEIEKLDHTWDYTFTVDQKATVYSAGSKHKECTECGEVLETAEIPQLKCSKPKLKSIENTQYGVLTKWSTVKGADKYRVYRKTSKTDWEYIGSTSKTYYTDKTAKSGTKYYYAVRARNEAGNSSLSSSLSKLYLADPTLKTPSSTKSGVSLKWTKTTGAQGYIIYRKTGSGSYKKLKTEKGVSNLSYVDKSAKKGKKYTYKVKAYYSKTYSAYSNTKTIKDKY